MMIKETSAYLNCELDIHTNKKVVMDMPMAVKNASRLGDVFF
jgi:hypothetical protein